MCYPEPIVACCLLLQVTLLFADSGPERKVTRLLFLLLL